MGVYDSKPQPFFIPLPVVDSDGMQRRLPCVGFDGGDWRLKGFVNHLISWLPDYALDDANLREFNHANGWEKTREAAVRIYTTAYPEGRGEIGEISLHAICRSMFDTVPLVPRSFYLTSANDVVKGFDLVHYRITSPEQPIEIWLGESKFYQDGKRAIADALSSIRTHIDHGFLKRDKLLIGPQIPKDTPRYEEVRALFQDSTPIDQLKARAVFPIGIFTESSSVGSFTTHCQEYISAVTSEIDALSAKVVASGLGKQISIVLIYVPLRSKAEIIEKFDLKLKAIQDD